MKISSVVVVLLSSCGMAAIPGVAAAVGLRSSNNEEQEKKQTKQQQQNNKNRLLIDFMQQAKDEKTADNLATLQDEGDASDVTVVDTLQEEEDAEDTMEEEAEDMELEKEVSGEANMEEEMTNRRRFVRYEPSVWETQWVDEIDDIMEAKSICRNLMSTPTQLEKLHDFMEVICTASIQVNDVKEGGDQTQTTWCYYHDQTHYMWYNVDNRAEFELYVDQTPAALKGVEPPEPAALILSDDHWAPIVSKLVYFDEFADEEYVEYIEPLVGTLRFPLAECLPDQPLLADVASYIIPPPYLYRTDGRRILYDVGSKDWSRLQYVVEQWALHDIDFTDIMSFSGSSGSSSGASQIKEATDDFPATVPAKHQEHIYREYLPLVDFPSPDKATIFLPALIQEMTQVNDYVLLKLDRVNAKLKETIVAYLLNDNDNAARGRNTIHVDELIWEVDNSDNFLFRNQFDATLQFDQLSSQPLADTYRQLQALRFKGIRAHAWI
mmetsp:Transcript_26308/g.43929  ORF Transcript_26308/g.43929 Transcript_26308/m.43929 type:complete len:494 (+) Transcript_26308:104-1585(+)